MMKEKVICIISIFVFCMFSLHVTAISQQITEESLKNQALFIQAKAQVLLDRNDKAIELYKKVLKNDRQNAAAAYELARIYQTDGDKLNAENFIKKAIDFDPQNKWYQLFWASYLKKENRNSEAAMAYESLLQLEPDKQSHLMNLASCQIEIGADKNAIETLNRLQKLKGIREETSRMKFEIYARLNEEKKAIKELENLIDSDPKNTRYLNNLAAYFSKIGKHNKAKELYAKVIKLEPQNGIANMAIAATSGQNQQEKAYLLSIRSLVANPQIPIDHKVKELYPFIKKARAVDAEENKITTAEILQELINAHRDDAKAYAIAGDYFMQIENYETAIKKYEKTLDLNKNVFVVWQQYMYALNEMEAFEKLQRVSETALELYPTQALVYYFGGISNYQLEDHRQSQALLEEALLMSRSDKELNYKILYLLIQSHMTESDFESANTYAQKAQELTKGNEPKELLSLLKELSEKERIK